MLEHHLIMIRVIVQLIAFISIQVASIQGLNLPALFPGDRFKPPPPFFTSPTSASCEHFSRALFGFEW